VNTLARRQELGEVAIIAAPVAGAGQGAHSRANGINAASAGLLAAVAMGEGPEAQPAQAGEKPAGVSQRELQELGSGPSRQGPVLDLSEDMHSLLLLLSWS
jgi:hypothetical protein